MMRTSRAVVVVCVAAVWAVAASLVDAADFKEAIVDAPLPAVEAARTMVVPDGFHVELFAGEPDVKQPIGFAIDDRGRLWVAEAYNYPVHGDRAGDRIVILEDSDGDGRADERTVFYDRLNYVTGIEVGFGGAWVMSPPYFYFIPDRNGDDVPDGEPEVLLDGFGNHANAHNLANGFAWGPDGWLYGTHGRTNWSLLGKPGTPEEERVRFDGGVYRYHPVRRVWEQYADGTTNPWGIDWNDVGEAFVCNCVNPHLFHVIPGAHYEPWRNRDSSRYAYKRIDTIADHLHFVGAGSVREGLGSAAEDAAGGGHAHCGTMVYLGDNWPERYRNTLFTNNIHGRRINNDLLRRAGSGYTAAHGADLMRSRDPWYMGVTLAYGSDGAVYASDWSDTGECHSTKNTRRETGRIYKIAYGKPQHEPIDVQRLGDLELAELQLHKNDWYVRHARRVLQERAATGRDLTPVAARLYAMFAAETDVARKLRALWALWCIGRVDAEFLAKQLAHDDENIRSWAVRLLCESPPSPRVLEALKQSAVHDRSPLVRLYLAAMLQRLPHADRQPIAEELLLHAEDADDENIPLMLWYGIEPLVEDVGPFLDLLDDVRMPLVARHIGRRAASLPDEAAAIAPLIDQTTRVDDAVLSELLAGIVEGFEGRRRLDMPENWSKCYEVLAKHKTTAVREQAVALALIFDDPQALAMLKARAVDASADAAARNRAVTALVAKKLPELPPLLLASVGDPIVRGAAIRGLAEYDHPDVPATLLAHYPEFDLVTRSDALQTLASRKAWAEKLLDAVEAGRVPSSDLTAFTARQLHNLRDIGIAGRVKKLWGEMRAPPADKAKQIADLKWRLLPETLAKADRSVGRAIFQKSCANCHKFFDAGGDIGPNITGSQRTNLDYLVQTLVDPSAAVANDYRMQIIETSTGRVITGLVVDESDAAVIVRTVNERLVVPKAEIESRTTSPLSMMPEGMLQNLSLEELRGLFAYLMGPDQVPSRQ